MWTDIYAADLPAPLTNELIIEGRRLLDRASRWFLLNRPQPLPLKAEIDRFAQPEATLRQKLNAMLRGNELAAVIAARRELMHQEVPPQVAHTISESLYAFSLLDIIDMAHGHGADATYLSHVYFELSDHLGFDTLLLAVSSLPRGGRWHSLARLALREGLYRSLRELALDVSRRLHPDDAAGVIEQFHAYNRPRLERARRTLDELQQTDEHDLAMLSVATAQLRRLTSAQV